MFLLSHPTRGGWIEINAHAIPPHMAARSHPTRGGGLKYGFPCLDLTHARSHPTRGGGIEKITTHQTGGFHKG